MTELSSTCEAIMQTPSEERLVALLDQWSPQWTWRGRQRAIGAGAYERYCTAMEVQVPCGKRCRMKRLTAMHASFIEEAFDTFGALPPKA